MLNLKACQVCFTTSGLFDINSENLGKYFRIVAGLQATDCLGMPQYLCVECSALVRKFYKFRDKCKRAHYTLKEIQKQNKQISLSTLQNINLESLNLNPSLSYSHLKTHYYEHKKFEWVTESRLCLPKSNKKIPIFHFGTLNVDNFDATILQDNVKLENANNDYIEVPINIEYDGLKNEDNIDGGNDNIMFDSDNDEAQIYDRPCKVDEDSIEADGTANDVEYAHIFPITETEAKAALEVVINQGIGNIACGVCGKRHTNSERLEQHVKRHDKHTSGLFKCQICHYHYKTDFLLKTHMTDKHMYKYVCKLCPDVNFDRISAKQHYLVTHLEKKIKSRPSWLRQCMPNTKTPKPTKKNVKDPKDFLKYSPVSQEEQYRLVQEKKDMANFTEATYKCQLCYKVFREIITYTNHMKIHDPKISGKFQCDMCKVYMHSTRKMYKHMIRKHTNKYTCQVENCEFVCYGRGQAVNHYKFHKNVTYPCPHCDKLFKKPSTQLTHIRLKHPSPFICNICGYSFVSENGLFCHKRIAHTKEENQLGESLEVDPQSMHYCAECKVQFVSEAAFNAHQNISSKHTLNPAAPPRVRSRGQGRPLKPKPKHSAASDIVNNGRPTATDCEVCGKFLSNDVIARRHYGSEHPGTDYLKRYMCDVCGHTTRQYANLLSHMRIHTNEKPYDCPHCDRKFNMPSNRDRHLVVHTGEKRYSCQHCSRRFTQSSAVKLHIQTVHLKIPYAPWIKKNRKRRKEQTGVADDAPTPQKLITLNTIDPQTDYLNAYITYNDE